jgi:phage terminase small subunit
VAKRRTPDTGPGGKALTKRQRAEGIAKWAELLTQGKPRAGKESPPTSDPTSPAGPSKTEDVLGSSEWPAADKPKQRRRKGARRAETVSGETPGTPADQGPAQPETPPAAPPAGDVPKDPAVDAVRDAADSTRDATDAPLTAKRARFVEEYLISLNASDAARKAGYSKKTAHQVGWELLREPEIQQAIAAARDKLSAELQIQLTDITRELARLGFANLADFHGITPDGEPFVDLSACTREQLAALQDLQVEDYIEGRGEDARMVRRVKIRLADKTKALEKLAELLGHGAKRKLEVSGGLKVEGKASDGLMQAIRRMETEDLQRYDALAREQEALLAKVRGETTT